MTSIRRAALAMGLLLPVSAVGETSSFEEQKTDFVAERCAESPDVYVPVEECEEAAARSFEIRQAMRALNARKAGKSAAEVAELYGLSAETIGALEGEQAAPAAE